MGELRLIKVIGIKLLANKLVRYFSYLTMKLFIESANHLLHPKLALRAIFENLTLVLYKKLTGCKIESGPDYKSTFQAAAISYT